MALAFAVRIVHVSWLSYAPYYDMMGYEAIARDFVAGRWLTTRTEWAPGYAVYLAALIKLLPSAWHSTALLGNCVADTATCAMVMSIAATLFGKRVALWAGLAQALLHPSILACGILYSEPLATFAATLHLVLLLTWWRRPSWPAAAALGACLGAAVLVRANTLTVAGLGAWVGVVAVRSGRAAFGHVAVHVAAAAAAMALVLAPFVVRTSLAVGRPAFLTTNAGGSLYASNNPTGRGGVTRPEFWPPEQYKAFLAHSAEGDAVMGQGGRRFIREQWLRVATQMIPARLAHMLAFDTSDPWLQPVMPWGDLAGGNPRTHPHGPFVFIPLLPAALLCGLGLSMFLSRGRVPGFCQVGIVMCMGPMLVFSGFPRYRMVADPLFCVLAGRAAALCVGGALRAWPRLRRAAVPAGLALTFAAGTAVRAGMYGGADILTDTARIHPTSELWRTVAAQRTMPESSSTTQTAEIARIDLRPASEPWLLVRYELPDRAGNHGAPIDAACLALRFFDQTGQQLRGDELVPTVPPEPRAAAALWPGPAFVWRVAFIPGRAATLAIDLVPNRSGSSLLPAGLTIQGPCGLFRGTP